MNLPITLDDSIPQQAGPGAGAELTAARIISMIEEAHMVTGENQYRNGRHFYRSQGHTANVCEHDLIGFARAIEREVRASLSHLAAPLAVEDSWKHCASSDAVRDVLAERERQQSVEGWTPEHDDEHGNHAMAIAAACYALWDEPALRFDTVRVPYLWRWTGWGESWFKPKDPRRNLIRAGALILAEIERMDRAAMAAASSGKEN